ncbi:MAG: DUF4402 domain-containing protein [Sphingomonadales bacterium]|nr:DUF4402 domain-containing protein [Sphingomonadales bacterium]
MPGTAVAASGSSGAIPGSAAATAVVPLTLQHWFGALDFGRFAVGSAGTVKVDAATGAGSVTGGAAFVTGSTTGMDYFLAYGDPNRLISITTGSGTVTSGARSMTFTTTPMLAAGYLPSVGSGYFTVGGTLSVAAGQGAGSYLGSYPVTVAYN